MNLRVGEGNRDGKMDTTVALLDPIGPEEDHYYGHHDRADDLSSTQREGSTPKERGPCRGQRAERWIAVTMLTSAAVVGPPRPSRELRWIRPAGPKGDDPGRRPQQLHPTTDSWFGRSEQQAASYLCRGAVPMPICVPLLCQLAAS
jgi:hypothetical protein